MFRLVREMLTPRNLDGEKECILIRLNPVIDIYEKDCLAESSGGYANQPGLGTLSTESRKHQDTHLLYLMDEKPTYVLSTPHVFFSQVIITHGIVTF